MRGNSGHIKCHRFGIGEVAFRNAFFRAVRLDFVIDGGLHLDGDFARFTQRTVNGNIAADLEFAKRFIQHDHGTECCPIHIRAESDLVTICRSVAVAVPVRCGIAALCKRDGFPQTGLAVKRIDIVRSIVHNKRPFFHTVVDGIRARIIHAVDPVIHTNGTVAAVLTRGVNRCAVTQPVIHAVRRELKRGRAVHAVPLAVGGIEVVVRAIQFAHQRTCCCCFTCFKNGERAVFIQCRCAAEFRFHSGNSIASAECRHYFRQSCIVVGHIGSDGGCSVHIVVRGENTARCQNIRKGIAGDDIIDQSCTATGHVNAVSGIGYNRIVERGKEGGGIIHNNDRAIRSHSGVVVGVVIECIVVQNHIGC